MARDPGDERRRPGVWRQGLRFGSIGCIGCATSVVIFLVVIAVLFSLATHN